MYYTGENYCSKIVKSKIFDGRTGGHFRAGRVGFSDL